MRTSDSESEDGHITLIGNRTAVDILRAPLELPPPCRRPSNMKHPVLKTQRKTSKYKGEGDFSPLFWKVVREMRLEEQSRNVTITELPITPRDNEVQPQLLYPNEIPKLICSDYSSDSEYSSDGDLASGETSSSDKENDDNDEQNNQEDLNKEVESGEERCESPVKRVISENSIINYDDSSDGDFD